MMTWFDWVLIAWWLFGAFMLVASVGKPRKPLEPTTAAIGMFIFVALIAGLLWTRGVL